jgi:hypothetical protein
MTAAAKLLIGVTLITAGLAKITDPSTLQSSIASFQLIPEVLLAPLSLWLPTFEIGVGALLATKSFEGGALAAATSLFGAFTTFYLLALLSGTQPSCSCFGKNPLLSAQPLEGLLRAAAFLLLCLTTWALSLKNRRRQ